MAKLFAWAPDAVENTAAIAERCAFTFEKQPSQLPNFPVPEGFDLPAYFEKIARDGFEARMPRWRAEIDAGRLRHPIELYRERLSRELKMVRDMGFAGYFLIVWDFIRFSREQGIPVGPGRGSAAGSLVAYCMQITDIDPMQFDLLFERFLNPERVSMPDIDIDFCFRNRERVIDYVTGKYGRPNVAQIITFGTMAARAVLRDAGRGLDIPYAEVDKIAKLIPQQPGQDITIAKALAEVPALKQAYESDPRVKELIDVGQRLEGLVRHASTHAAGVVIAPQADRRVRAALPGHRRRDHDAVRDVRYRGDRPPQDGFSRAEDADADRRRLGVDRKRRPVGARTWTLCSSTTRRFTICSARRAPRGSSSSNRRGCGTS